MLRTVPPRGEHLARLRDAVLHAAVARRGEFAVDDIGIDPRGGGLRGHHHRARGDELRAGRVDRGRRGRDLRDGGVHRCLGAAHSRAVVVEFLHRRSPFARQRFRARELALRGVEFGFALPHERLGRGLVAHPLRDLGLDAGRVADRLLMPRARFVELRFEHGELHPRKRLARFHEVAFVDIDAVDAAGKLGRDVDFGRLDTAVAARERVARAVRVQSRPRMIAGRRGDEHRCGGNQPCCPCCKVHCDGSREVECPAIDGRWPARASCSRSPPSAE